MSDDSNRCYRQSAAVPYRQISAGLEVLLITSFKAKRWIVPKGIVERNLTPAQSAAAEAYEEAGVRGQMSGRSLGSYKHKKWGGVCTVEVFPLKVDEVLNDWPEKAYRARQWVPLEDAASMIHRKSLAEIILELGRRK